jgi:hypothetical protein
MTNQLGLRDTDPHLTIGSNGEAFHAFVGDAAGRVAAGLCGTHRTQVGNGERARQREGFEGLSGGVVKLLHVETVGGFQ